MATATTVRELSARLEREVASHGCSHGSCDLCSDAEACLAPPALPVAMTSRVEAVDVPAHEESLLGRQDAQFDALPCY
jgi:hypothetical protein